MYRSLTGIRLALKHFMSKYDKELDTRTREYEEAVKPVPRQQQEKSGGRKPKAPPKRQK